jgi:amino acid permease
VCVCIVYIYYLFYLFIAFVCHHNSFLIFGSLKQPSLNRFATVTHWSMGIAFSTCLALAVSGYLVFTDKTAGKVYFILGSKTD